MEYYTECSWGCNRCPEAIADMTARYTEGQKVEKQIFNAVLKLRTKSCDTFSPTDLVVVGDEAMLAHIYTMLEAE